MNHFNLPKIKNCSASVLYNNTLNIYLFKYPFHYLNQSKCVNLCPEPISYSIILYRFLVCGRTKTRLKSSTQKYSHQKTKNFNLTTPSGENTIKFSYFHKLVTRYFAFYTILYWNITGNYTLNFIGYWRKLPSLINDGMNLYIKFFLG